MDETPVVAAGLGPEAGMIGAAVMAASKWKVRPDAGPTDRLRRPRSATWTTSPSGCVKPWSTPNYIACEDTRRTGRLLERLEIRPEAAPRLEPRRQRDSPAPTELVKRIERGERITLVSDAGMPAISDPGYRLVRACIDRGLEVNVLPGPSVIPVALVASGLPTDRWRFEGFLPKRSGEMERVLQLDRDRHRLRVAPPHLGLPWRRLPRSPRNGRPRSAGR